MTELSDLELIQNVKDKQCDLSFLELKKRHEKLYFDIYKKYKTTIDRKQNYSCIQDDVVYSIYDAIVKFDPVKETKFSTYLGNYARYKCLKLIDKKPDMFPLEFDCKSQEHNIGYKTNQHIDKTQLLNKIKLVDVIDDKTFDSIAEIEYLDDEKLSTFILNKISNPKVRKIFYLRFFSENKKDRTWKKIGEKLGFTAQTAINLYERELKYLKNIRKRLENV